MTLPGRAAEEGRSPGVGSGNGLPGELDALLRRDPFGHVLGAEHEEIRPGFARVRLDLRPEHQNFVGTPHGGVIFSLADLALAAACNAGGTLAALVSASLNYTAAPARDARLVAEATEVALSRRLGVYRLEVRSSEGVLVASGQATVYRWPGRPQAALAD